MEKAKYPVNDPQRKTQSPPCGHKKRVGISDEDEDDNDSDVDDDTDDANDEEDDNNDAPELPRGSVDICSLPLSIFSICLSIFSICLSLFSTLFFLYPSSLCGLSLCQSLSIYIPVCLIWLQSLYACVFPVKQVPVLFP